MKSVLINGLWQKGEGKSYTKYNPATGEEIFSTAYASEQQAIMAVGIAKQSFKSWKKTPLSERITALEKYASLLADNQQALIKVIAQETGKPYWEAEIEVQSAIAKIAISITAFQQRTGTVLINQDNTMYYQHQAHGIFVVLGPYNFPLHLPNGHIVPALLAGNTIVFKPSEYTTQTAMFMIRLLLIAGVPSGVIQLVSGDAIIGNALISEEDIAGVLFTGSYHVGKKIHAKFAGKVDKILALEMGGNNPLIIWETKNIDAACYHTMVSAYLTAGQRCTCARRLIIPDDALGDAIIQQISKLLQKISVGTPDDHPDVFMGAVISYDVAQQILQKQQKLIQQGAMVLHQSILLREKTGLLSPSLLDVSKMQSIPDEEIFAPLLQIYRVSSFDMAIAKANQTKYGLAAGLLSDNENLFNLFSQDVRAGIINFNQPLTGASSQAPFGGIGLSGNHRPSAFYAADYCAYPVASIKKNCLEMPQNKLPSL